MKTITADNFDAEVLGAEGPILVDFWATWCRPCEMLSKVLEEIDAEFGDKITIAKVDTDNNIEPTVEWGIMSIPTMLVFQDGKEIYRMTGAKNKPALLHELGQVVNLQ